MTIKREELKTKNENFIGVWDTDNNELMKNIINFFEANKDLQKKGIAEGDIKPKVKDSIDISISPKLMNTDNKYIIFKNYMNLLNECYQDYNNKYEVLKTIPKLQVGKFNIQKYHIGGHFKKWHWERTSLVDSHRIFAWMTYLNTTPEDEGSTDFLHYNVSIKPKIGRTLIWPAEWTHAHRGQPTKTKEKYILTGWFTFI